VPLGTVSEVMVGRRFRRRSDFDQIAWTPPEAALTITKD
jgi:hypothetical protein